MSQMIMLILIGILSCTCIILAVLLAEHRSEILRGPVKRWRDAYAMRKTVNEEKSKARNAEYQAKNAQISADKADERIAKMGSYIIAEQCAEHIKTIKADNYHAKEKKVLRSIEFAAKNGYHLPKDEQDQLTRMLVQAHEKALRLAAEKQRQAEIKEQIRDEERAQREIQRAIKKAQEARAQKEREAEIKRKALEEAIALLGDSHSEQIEEMKRKLAVVQAEAEEARLSAERAMSMAQQTKRGHIYVISNIGSFGEDVYKVGMTRRLEPMDRVKELGDASVPFKFDVHAMISSENAPSLENALHKRLEEHRVNKVNLRKEYFRVNLDTIIKAVKDEHGEIDYVADPEAFEYFESIAVDEDIESLESKMSKEATAVEE